MKQPPHSLRSLPPWPDGGHCVARGARQDLRTAGRH
jgi:hypothetical protein